VLNRRNFLRGAAGVSVALPFLEGLPERSAWAQNDTPVFSFFVCAVDGCVPESFFPDALGPLSEANLGAAGKATSELARHADQLLFLSGINWPMAAATNDAHTQGLVQALTARVPEGGGPDVTSTGPSADAVIASFAHPDKTPINLHGGSLNSYGGHLLSFAAAGQLSQPIANPYTLYRELVGLLEPDAISPEGQQAAELLLTSRNSIHDLVRDDLDALMANPRLSSADHERLERHFQAIRDAEITMDGMGDDALEMCRGQGLEVSKLEALEAYTYDPTATEQIVLLHMSLVALAFACNHRRTATLQWGDPYDRTIYDVPSNERAWPFAFIDHRAQSDSATGDDPLAAQAHAEIDVVRMQTLAAGLDHFAEHGLVDQCVVLWTLNYRDGAIHSYHNIPHILWGSAGGSLKQGEYLAVGGDGGTTNNQLHNTLITAAIQDTGEIVDDFGEGTLGLLEEILTCPEAVAPQARGGLRWSRSQGNGYVNVRHRYTLEPRPPAGAFRPH
jgi:hypothetical protein